MQCSQWINAKSGADHLRAILCIIWDCLLPVEGENNLVHHVIG